MSDKITDALDKLYTDFLLLQEGAWEPDRDSIEALIMQLDIIAITQNHSLEDTRDDDESK